MAFSNTCAVKFLPLLIRLVLCAIFLPAGWHKIMNTTEFSVVEANQLLSIGVSAEGLDWQRIQSTGFGSKSSGAEQSTDSQTTAKTPPRSARSLYKVALTADHAGFPYPAIASWLVGLAELGGSILLLTGAFTRISAFGIATVMAGAFWMTSWGAVAESGWWTILETSRLQAIAQVSLFLLALNIVLVGPGFFSVDGMMGAAPKKSKGGAVGGEKPARKEPN